MKKLLIPLLLFFSSFLAAQKWQIINNINHVYDISEYKDELCISSWGGVAFLQGNTEISKLSLKRQLTTVDGLSSNDIRHLAYVEDSDNLWMASGEEGISITVGQGIMNFGEELGLPSLLINAIVVKDKSIFVATEEGIAKYNYISGVNFPLMEHVYNNEYTNGALPVNSIKDMLYAADGKLYLAHSNGLSYVDADSLGSAEAWESIPMQSSLTDGGKVKIAANDRYLVFVLTGRGIVYYKDLDDDSGAWQYSWTMPAAYGTKISTIYLDEEDQLWIAHGEWDEGTMRYKNPTGYLLSKLNLQSQSVSHFRQKDNGLGQNSFTRIRKLCNRLYFASWGDGIATIENGNFCYYEHNSIAFPKVTQSTADLNNKLWFASGVVGDYVAKKSTMGVCSLDPGGLWEDYNRDNSKLHSNNILCVGVDNKNRKWFGAWDSEYSITGNYRGLTIFDEETDRWLYLTRHGMAEWDDVAETWGPWIAGSPQLLSSTISGIYRDKYDNMFVLCYDRGVSVLNSDLALISSFTLPNTVNNRVTRAYHNGRQYFFGTEYDNGLNIWNDDSIPISDGEHWVKNIVPELKTGIIYGITSVQNYFGNWQHFIAAGSGLYMWDERNWYKFDAYIKILKYDFARNDWVQDTLYYEDEERIFGALITYPLCIYGDPFGRIWVGTDSNGLSMYDPFRERFVNYFMDNSPLLSNNIISLGYDPVQGRLLIGSTEGINAYNIGLVEKPDIPLGELKAYPNPFYPKGLNNIVFQHFDENSLPKGTFKCNIYDAEGNLVIELKESILGNFEWNGKNESGKIVSSGTYFFVVSDDKGNVRKGKFALIH